MLKEYGTARGEPLPESIIVSADNPITEYYGINDIGEPYEKLLYEAIYDLWIMN